MDTPIEYCVLVFVVVIIAIILTHIEKEVIFVIIGLLVLYNCKQSKNNKKRVYKPPMKVESYTNIYELSGDSIDNKINIIKKEPSDSYAIHNQEDTTADGLLYKAAINNGRKGKISKDIRSSWNNSNVKKYFVDELSEQDNRNWWEDDIDELKKNNNGKIM